MKYLWIVVLLVIVVTLFGCENWDSGRYDKAVMFITDNTALVDVGYLKNTSAWDETSLKDIVNFFEINYRVTVINVEILDSDDERIHGSFLQGDSTSISTYAIFTFERESIMGLR